MSHMSGEAETQATIDTLPVTIRVITCTHLRAFVDSAMRIRHFELSFIKKSFRKDQMYLNSKNIKINFSKFLIFGDSGKILALN